MIKLRIQRNYPGLFGPKCNHTYPYKREKEGDFIIHRKGRGNVTTELEIKVMWLKVKGFWQLPEAGRVKE